MRPLSIDGAISIFALSTCIHVITRCNCLLVADVSYGPGGFPGQQRDIHPGFNSMVQQMRTQQMYASMGIPMAQPSAMPGMGIGMSGMAGMGGMGMGLEQVCKQVLQTVKYLEFLFKGTVDLWSYIIA